MDLFTLFPTKKKKTNKHKKLTRLLVDEINPWLTKLVSSKRVDIGLVLNLRFYWHRLRSVNNELGQYSATACLLVWSVTRNSRHVQQTRCTCIYALGVSVLLRPIWLFIE